MRNCNTSKGDFTAIPVVGTNPPDFLNIRIHRDAFCREEVVCFACNPNTQWLPDDFVPPTNGFLVSGS